MTRGYDDEHVGYQGERLSFAVNRQAADDLASVFGIAAHDSSLSPRRRSAQLTLPDGRTLTVTVDVTDVGAVYDAHGEWVDDDRRSHADVSGDFAVEVAARRVIAAATAPVGTLTEYAAAVADVARIRAAADNHLDEVDAATAGRVMAAAMRVADATRQRRVADAHRRHRDAVRQRSEGRSS